MNTKPNILIFSVFKNTDRDLANHESVLVDLEAAGIPHLELLGSYKGIPERSILVEGFRYRDLVEMLCESYSQDCYLESHNDRESFLVYHNGKVVSIGKLTPVSKEDALKSDAWSFNPITKQYFVTKGA